MRAPGTVIFNWITAPEPFPKHAKFLSIVHDSNTTLLYAGNFEYHKDLAGYIIDFEEATLLAAGDLSLSGDVTGWKSSGYDFTTPPEMRPIIERILLENRPQIRKRWPKSVRDNL